MLKCSKHFAIGAGLLITSAPELLHRQHVNLKLKAASQFMACGHNARVFTVADQDVVAAVQRKAPEWQHTPCGHVLAEGESMTLLLMSNTELNNGARFKYPTLV
mgnify:CR=1 FL=1